MEYNRNFNVSVENLNPTQTCVVIINLNKYTLLLYFESVTFNLVFNFVVFLPKPDLDQTAMGLPPVVPCLQSVYLIVK
jgi:hypothetical protein